PPPTPTLFPYTTLFRSRGINSAGDLKGKSVGISRYGSSTDAAADFALKHLNLTRNDVHILQLGGAATRMAAAIAGRVDGTFEQRSEEHTSELQSLAYLV